MIPTSQTVVVSTQPLLNDTSFLVILGIFIILFIYLIVREFRRMKVLETQYPERTGQA